MKKFEIVVSKSPRLSNVNGMPYLINVSVYQKFDGFLANVNPTESPVIVRWCIRTSEWKDHDKDKPWLCLNDGVRYIAPSECVQSWIREQENETKRIRAKIDEIASNPNYEKIP
mgnify:CR=1 FL=1